MWSLISIFSAASFINPDLARISNSTTILQSCLSSVSLVDLKKKKKKERAGKLVITGDSQCFWLFSSLLARWKEDGFRPSDPTLFNKNISMLSAALASQTTVAAGLTDFVTSKRWESSLPHASCPFAGSQSRELLVAPGTGSLLFDHPLLGKIFSQFKEDSLIVSSVQLRSAVVCRSTGRCGKGADPWVVEVWRLGYHIPFRWAPTFSEEPISYPSYSPTSIRGKALEG